MCVYETGLLLLFAYIVLLLLPLSFVLGVGAPSLSLVGIIMTRNPNKWVANQEKKILFSK